MHLHHAIGIFVMFMLAQCVHAWQRASETVNSKLNGITTYGQYIHLRAADLASRIMLVSFIFGGWASGELYVLIGYLAPQTGQALAAHPVSVNWWTAGLLGYFGDSVVYFIIGLAARFWPGIRQEVPPTLDSSMEKQIENPPAKE